MGDAGATMPTVEAYPSVSFPTTFADGVSRPVGEGKPMTRSSESVSWTGFGIVVTALLTLGIAVVGRGFAWLHTDMREIKAELHTDVGEIKADMRDIRGSVAAIADRVASIDKQTAITSTKLDSIADGLHKQR